MNSKERCRHCRCVIIPGDGDQDGGYIDATHGSMRWVTGEHYHDPERTQPSA